MVSSIFWRLSGGCKFKLRNIIQRPKSSPSRYVGSRPRIEAITLKLHHDVILRSNRISSCSLHSSNQDKRKLISRNTVSNTTIPWYPPTSGLLSKLPASWIPYAELIRLDKPTGTYYLFLPCLFSTLLAAPLVTPCPSPTSVLGTSLLFFTGAFVMRGAGCTINDLWDRNLDPNVSRTRLRPIARGAITPFKALVFTGVQLIFGLGILLQFPYRCVLYGIPSLILVTIYPLAKRFTHYPQVMLGLTFSWGAIMGFPALGIELYDDSNALITAALIYFSNMAWTVFYDMIYAHMDIKDDFNAGIKSIALRHNLHTKQILTGLAIAQIALITGAGVMAGSGPLFFIGSCGGASITLAITIINVNLKSVKNCWWWFVNGCWITGGVISTGMASDYLLRYSNIAQVAPVYPLQKTEE